MKYCFQETTSNQNYQSQPTQRFIFTPVPTDYPKFLTEKERIPQKKGQEGLPCWHCGQSWTRFRGHVKRQGSTKDDSSIKDDSWWCLASKNLCTNPENPCIECAVCSKNTQLMERLEHDCPVLKKNRYHPPKPLCECGYDANIECCCQ